MPSNLAYVIMGGTFDPVHNGHISLARALYRTFGQKVVFMPTAPPNYKQLPTTTANERLDMLKLAINDNPHFVIDSSEILQQKYIPTIDSLKALRKKIGYDIPLYFLIGEDSLVNLDTWDSWQMLFNLTNFIVAMRPGYSLDQMSEQLKAQCTKRTIKDKSKLIQPFGQIYFLDFTPLNISSTNIRNNYQQKLPTTGMVDPKVDQYIKDNKLYSSNQLC
ncbi:MAG: nadD [Burkholderiales bacterium]|jgi:nicotinate-nucleotide adenylyltransferase|nr:nadD [Burkholderiales bacterium]